LLTRETLAVMLPVAVTLLEAVSEEVADVVAVELTDCKGRRGERWQWTGAVTVLSGDAGLSCRSYKFDQL